MSRCDTNSMPTPKACTGRCMKEACNSSAAMRVWVIAACEGMVSLFDKDKHGAVVLKPQDSRAVFTSLEHFQHTMEQAEQAHRFDQLIIVGSANDIAWIHSSLPRNTAHLIAAEIKYPLLSNWFKEPLPMPHLTQALQSVLSI